MRLKNKISLKIQYQHMLAYKTHDMNNLIRNIKYRKTTKFIFQ